MPAHTDSLLISLGKLRSFVVSKEWSERDATALQTILDALNPFDALSSTQDQEQHLLMEFITVRELAVELGCDVSTLDKVCHALSWTILRAQRLDLPKQLEKKIELSGHSSRQASYGNLPSLYPDSGASTTYPTGLNTPADLTDLFPPGLRDMSVRLMSPDDDRLELPIDAFETQLKVSASTPRLCYAMSQIAASRCQPTIKNLQLLHYPGYTKTPVVQPLFVYDAAFCRYKIKVDGAPKGWGWEKYIVAKGDKIVRRIDKHVTLVHAEEITIQMEFRSEIDLDELVHWIKS